MSEATIALPAPVRPDEFRAFMAEFPTADAVVTALDGEGRPWGTTCASLGGLCASPPTLMLCLRTGSPTPAALMETGVFAVNLLHGAARGVGRLFGSGNAGDAGRFDLVPWSPGEGGPRLPHHAAAVADCRVVRTTDAESHLVVFGEVFAVTTS